MKDNVQKNKQMYQYTIVTDFQILENKMSDMILNGVTETLSCGIVTSQ
jgi:hypothetical protein